uniref:Uncharacterized protein n=1 Tax=viral metagenome TaxID=1070528 RepID=A0A6C0C668_9ZZZZ
MKRKFTGEEMADINLFIVKDYINLQQLPENVNMTISQIQKLNFNKEKKTVGHILNYGLFTSVAPNLFPSNSLFDYVANDCVSPIIIIDDNGNRYRINHIYWQMVTMLPDDIFPIKVFVDEKHTWINNLINQ